MERIILPSIQLRVRASLASLASDTAVRVIGLTTGRIRVSINFLRVVPQIITLRVDDRVQDLIGVTTLTVRRILLGSWGTRGGVGTSLRRHVAVGSR